MLIYDSEMLEPNIVVDVCPWLDDECDLESKQRNTFLLAVDGLKWVETIFPERHCWQQFVGHMVMWVHHTVSHGHWSCLGLHANSANTIRFLCPRSIKAFTDDSWFSLPTLATKMPVCLHEPKLIIFTHFRIV